MRATHSYCIQCTDLLSGKVGDFVFLLSKPFEACSPVFDHLVQLCPWMHFHGFIRVPEEGSFTLRKLDLQASPAELQQAFATHPMLVTEEDIHRLERKWGLKFHE